MRAFHRNHFGAMSQADRDTFTLKSSVRDGYMVYNLDSQSFERYDALLGWIAVTLSGVIQFPVQVRSMKDDSNQGGITPPLPAHGDCFVVNNWGVGNYVGDYIGAYAVNDLAVYDASLAGFRRVLAAVAGQIRDGTRVLVIPAGALGSFAGMENRVARWSQAGAAWLFEVPQDGWLVYVIGEQTPEEGTLYIYDDSLVPGWYPVKSGIGRFVVTNGLYVDKSGNDVTGDGSTDNPFLNISRAIQAALPNDAIFVGPGTYVDYLVPDKNLQLAALIPGTVTVRAEALNSMALDVSAIGCTSFESRGISYVQFNDASPNDVAIRVNSNLSTKGVHISAPFVTVGAVGAIGLATSVFGANSIDFVLAVPWIIGNHYVNMITPTSLAIYGECGFVRGGAAWFTFIGNGILGMSECGLLGLNGVENFLFGTGAAVNGSVGFTGSAFNGTLTLNNVGGVGRCGFQGASFARIQASAPDQAIEHNDGRRIIVEMFRVTLNAAAIKILKAVPAGRSAVVEWFNTMNLFQASGAALRYQVNGSGAGTVVAPVGPGILTLGCHNEATVPDLIPGGGSLALQIMVASGQANDRADVRASVIMS